MEKQFDAIVAGAGPAGSTTAFLLARAGARVLLLDKARFPRDKTCADNKSWICTSVLKEMGLWKSFQRIPRQEITGMLFSSPAGHEMEVSFEKGKLASEGPHYNVRRKIFDNFLFKAAKKQGGVQALEQFEVRRVLKKNDFVVGVEGSDLKGKRREFFARVVVGADGSNSAVARSSGIEPVVRSRHALSARAYYSGVECERDKVELHYLPGVSPGYFWIFPVDSGLCNVGVGLPTRVAMERKLSVPALLGQIISSPQFSQRFSQAKRASPISEWGMTITSERRRRCGNGFVLVGDAGATAVAFAGEGCGPAMRSGKIAAAAIMGALRQGGDFSEKSLRHLYEEKLWKVMGPENKAVQNLELLTTHPRLFDFVMKRASRSKELSSLAGEIASDYRNAAKLLRPSTALKLLFG